MMVKSFIDMSRPHMLYASGLGIIMLMSLAVSNIPALSFSAYFDFAWRREACAALFLSGAGLGMWAIQRHMMRARKPWRVPQSQITLPYAGFFILTMLGIAMAR